MYNFRSSAKSFGNVKDLLEVKLFNDEFSILMNLENAKSSYGSNDAMLKNRFLNITLQPSDEFFLFISDNISLSFEEGSLANQSCIVGNFFEAKNKLIHSLKPNLIVIDVPLKLSDLLQFKSWLKSNELHHIPIFYNDRFLQKEQICFLFVQKFVDDVIHLEKDLNKLSNKAKFLNKVRLQSNLKVLESVSKIEIKKARSGIMFLFDIFFAFIAILLFTPIFGLIAVAIRLESKGPIFYSSSRTGIGFKIFDFYKFRTMVVDADKRMDELKVLNIYASDNEQAKFFKVKNDPRVTKVGAFLRNTSLDELPQLFNVLKGDMSIVGNRPLPIYEAATLTTNEWAERFMAPAGITGLWQISKRGNPEMSTAERISLDINYARNRSNFGDLKILINTPFALKQKANV